MSGVSSARRRLLAGALLVGLGWLASPSAVPVYDGIGSPPDEPYRYVSLPDGATRTAPPTSLTTQVQLGPSGTITEGLAVQTSEVGPQISAFFPPMSLRAKRGPLTIELKPEAPTDAPKGGVIDGNVYAVAVSAVEGPVEVDRKFLSAATMYLRATDQVQPQPRMFYRAQPTDPWRELHTTPGGLDIRVASFLGPGQYVLARLPADLQQKAKGSGSGVPVVPLVLLGILVVLGAVVMVVRLRAAGE